MNRFFVAFLFAFLSVAFTATAVVAKSIIVDESNSASMYSILAERGITVSLKGDTWTPWFFDDFGRNDRCNGAFLWFKNNSGSTHVRVGVTSKCDSSDKGLEKFKNNLYNQVYGTNWYADQNVVTKSIRLGSGEEVAATYNLLRGNDHKRNVWIVFASPWKGRKEGFIVKVFNYNPKSSNAEEEIPLSMVEEILGSIHLLGVDEIPKKVVAEPPS